jgi:hypothetical protein
MIQMKNQIRLLFAAFVLLFVSGAQAANRTSWTAGNGQGLTWGAIINSADMASMPNGDSVLSSVTGVANGTNLDQFMDISCELTIASSAVAAGANLALWIYPLQEDGSTYGDGLLTAGTAAAVTPAIPPAAVIPLYASTRTTIIGQANALVLPPGTFKVVIQNNTGFALTSGTQTCDYRTYNINLND